jgi:hypothetical protein
MAKEAGSTMDTTRHQHDFYLIVHDVEYKGIQRIKTTVINKKFESLDEAQAALQFARTATPQAYIVGYSYPA